MLTRSLIACLLLTASVALANKVSVEAVLDRTAVPPGGKATLALVFTIEPGWHLYWINPGETGVPPSVKWTLPAGVKVSDLRFPTPKRINANGLTAYGYEDSLTLLADVELSAEAKSDRNGEAGGEIALSGLAKWVVCEEACIAERQPVAIKLAVGPGHPNAEDRFKAWHVQQPIRATTDKTVAAQIGSDGRQGSLAVPVAAGQTGAEIFPPYAPFLIYEEIKPDSAVKTQKPDICSLSFRVLPDAPAEFSGKGIVAVRGADGKPVAEEMTFTFKFR